MKFCSNCGNQMNDDERFCTACGTDSQQDVNSARQQQDAQQSQMYTSETSGQQGAQQNYTYGAGQQSTQQNYTYGAGQQGTQQSYTYGAGQQGTQQNYTYGAGQQSAQQTYTYGAGQQYGQPVYGSGPKASNNKILKKLPVFAVAAVVVVVGLVFLFRCVVGSGSLTMKGAVKDYFKAVENGDGRKIMNATLSNPMIKVVKESEDLTKKDIIDSLEVDYDTYGMKVDYRNIEIEDKEKWDKDEVDEFNESCKDGSGIDPHVKKVYDIEVSYEYRYSYDGEWGDWSEESIDLSAYKSNGNWYVIGDVF